MTLQFNVNKQRIGRVDSERPHSGSRGYLYTAFIFSSDWDGLTRTAIFTDASGKPYAVLLINDSCEVPHEVITTDHFLVSVRGDSADGVTVFLPTMALRVPILPAGATEGETPADPTPDVYSQLLDSMREPYIGENGNWYVWDKATRQYADTGRPARGEIGPVGNVMYATFGYDAATGEITMHTPDGYTGPTFSINSDGEFVVEVA